MKFLATILLLVPAIAALEFPQCPSPSWPTGPGSEIRAPGVPRDMARILSGISDKRIEAIIKKLTTFHTRHTLSRQDSPTIGIGAARDWIKSEYDSFGGNLQVSIQTYLQPIQAPRIDRPVNISNIVAVLPGYDANRVYVITGHYDTRASDVMNPDIEQHGANDDASGVAAVMEVARVFAKQKFPATLIFAAVAGEEQGLYGSNHLAQTLKAAGIDVQGMFTSDIVGSSTADDGVKDPFSVRLFAQGIPLFQSSAVQAAYAGVGGENDSPARQLARYAASVASNIATGMKVRIVYRLDRYLRGGDHRPFLIAGYPAARFTEPNENYAHQHQDIRVENGKQYGDLAEFCDFQFIQRVSKVNAATLWNLASAPGTPKNVTIDTIALGNDSKMMWIAAKDDNLKGYEIVWRPTTAPDWTNEIWVGLVNEATVDLSKDNVVFGVRAVGKNGYKSPVAFPLPSV
jgi:Zn-dependent M28 family amino/carboxypeptidase